MKNILIVEDHPILLHAYISKMKNYKDLINSLNFISAANCQDALMQINTYNANSEAIDYAIIDVNLAPFNEIKSGIDLVFELKKKHPDCKVLILTSFTNPLAIYNLITSIDVKIIVCKSDIDSLFFDKLFELFHKEDNFMSETVSNEMNKIAKSKLKF